MDAFETRFHRELVNDIDETTLTKVNAVTNGLCQSFDDYRYRIGVLAGLAEARQIAEDVRKRLSGGA
jgi:hypothetical protein